MTATFAADIPLATAQDHLAAIGQWLPIDGDPSLPIGTLVDRDSTGPLRLGYGAWRDLLLGVQFINGRDELISAGGRTVKNVAGYDLTKFMVGQHGVFGRLLTITTRTYRRPESALRVRFEAGFDPGTLLATDLRPQWAARTPDGVWCGYLGDAATIGFCQNALPALRPISVESISLEGDGVARQASQAGGAWLFRAALPPARVLGFVEAARLASWSADAIFGVVRAPMAGPDDIPRLFALTKELGGAARAISPDGAMAFAQATGGERLVLARLKSALDPYGQLAPLPELL